MPTKHNFCEALYHTCLDLRNQLEFKLSLAKRKRTNILAKEGREIIINSNAILNLYEESKKNNEST